MAIYNNIDNYPILNTFMKYYKIDNILRRTYYLHDVINRKGHDIVYYNRIDNIILEGECLGDGIIDRINS